MQMIQKINPVWISYDNKLIKNIRIFKLSNFIIKIK